MPSSNTSLPLELLDMIIQHLSSDAYALRNCALVSRTWSGFSQHALFRNAQVDLHTYKKMTELLDDLVSVPHLQTLIRDVKIYQFVRWRRSQQIPDDIQFPTYMSCLTSVLSLLPNLAKVVLFHETSWLGEDYSNRAYLDLIPNVLGSAPLVELDIGGIYSVESLRHVFEVLEGRNIKRVSLSGFNNSPTTSDLGVSATSKRIHLPSLECIRSNLSDLQNEFYDCLTRSVDLPHLKQCEIITDNVDDLNDWSDVLLRGFPPLELFKLELTSDFDDDEDYTGIPEEDAYRPLPFGGLQFRHVHLSVKPKDLSEIRKFIEWWSSTFRALSDSDATIHFTELTLAFTDLPDIHTLEATWNSLDDSLAHTTFSSVRSIHFERNGQHTAESITEAAYPVLADKIRLALPRLASRGVLSLI